MKAILFKKYSDLFFQKVSLQIFVFLILSFILFFAFKNNKTQDPLWFVQYLSGAINLSSDQVWRFSENELVEIMESNDPELIYNYNFKKYPNEELISNHYNAKGYLYIVWFVSKLFWWIPLVKGLQLFQFSLHIAISFVIYFSFKEKNSRALFLFLYFFNPIIIYLTTFPFYYYYQVVPTFFIIILWKRKLSFPILVSMFSLMGFLLNVRMTMLFAVLVAFIILFRNYSFKLSVLILAIFTGVFVFTKEKNTVTSRWHTTYVGIGAYPNKYLTELSDYSGVILFEETTNQSILPVLERSTEYIENYSEVCKAEYYRIAKETPLLILKNGLLNILQSFSIGHLANRGLFINLSSAFIGLLFIVWLLYKKMYFQILTIGLISGSFTPYFPPIQQYMFGSYLFIIWSAIESFNRNPFYLQKNDDCD